MASFSSKIGVLLAAAGSAVGLGSIWKFPYVVGENGGGAFIILYVACSLIFGLPLVMNDFLIGKVSGLTSDVIPLLNHSTVGSAYRHHHHLT